MTTSTPAYSAPDTPSPGTWVLDPSHTTVEAVARHLMVSKVRGRFVEVEGTLQVADDLADSSVSVTANAASITTGEEDRDNHLRSPDFLDADNFKTLTFKSTSLQQAGDAWKLTGDLTIRGVTLPTTLDLEYHGVMTDPWGNEKAVFSATGEFKREDYGLVWNAPLEGGGVLVGPIFKLELEAQFVKQ